MDGVLQAPQATAFDAIASLISLSVYLGVAIAMVARRRDAAARVFFAVAVASAVPYMLSALQWWKGAGIYSPAVVALTTVAFCIGSVALFHFTQIFPWRRPWVQKYGPWLIALYALPPLPVALVAWLIAGILGAGAAGAGGIGAVSAGIAEAFVLLAALPVIFFIGVVLPLAGVLSLVKSWREAGTTANEPARRATFWMLMSQMGGGLLAVLVIPLLRVVGVPPIWSTIFGALAYGFALMMPLAFFSAPGQ